MDLALELQSRGKEEVLSVKRWDTVAGGEANWDFCVQLLQDATTTSLEGCKNGHNDDGSITNIYRRVENMVGMETKTGTGTGTGMRVKSYSSPIDPKNRFSLTGGRKKTNNFFSSECTVISFSSSSMNSNNTININLPICDCENNPKGDDECQTLIWEMAFRSALRFNPQNIPYFLLKQEER